MQMSEDDEEVPEECEVPLNDHTFNTLPKGISCSFEDKTEMGKRFLLLNMQIKGAPFNGSVYIDQSL